MWAHTMRTRYAKLFRANFVAFQAPNCIFPLHIEALNKYTVYIIHQGKWLLCYWPSAYIWKPQSDTQKSSVNCKRKENFRTCLTGGVPQRSWKCSAGHDSVCYCWCFAGVKEECTTWIKKSRKKVKLQHSSSGFRVQETPPEPMLAGSYYRRMPESKRLFKFIRDAASPNERTQEIYLRGLSTFPL